MKHILVLIFSLAFAQPGFAGIDFGAPQEADALADRMIGIIDNEGLDAAVEAMHDPSQPFRTSRMGVNLFRGSFVISDNREPEMVASDYGQTADLTGAPAWPRIVAAARDNGVATLLWYHYDTQEVYEYQCHARAAKSVDASVMVCR
ncbi:hypothetical protein GV827_00350 [Sulfitobacter sp. JBTF-M27]|uniref:Uncharacterized protein n=1 Tax=Sulfitobacter sediminilitoris TaxID=2698830 RepID=A0A6P0C3Y9_9RHOB|nr:hypothetical protein [Sulfitobacter sediminilitoris]NEK20851.1 hypothetical protein [Sulfitobacter sediminilitoris]